MDEEELQYGYGFDTPVNMYHVDEEQELDEFGNPIPSTTAGLNGQAGNPVDLGGYTNANGDALNQDNSMADIVYSQEGSESAIPSEEKSDPVLDTAAKVDPTGTMAAVKAASDVTAKVGQAVFGEDEELKKFNFKDAARQGFNPVKMYQEYKDTKKRRKHDIGIQKKMGAKSVSARSTIFNDKQRRMNNPYKR